MLPALVASTLLFFSLSIIATPFDGRTVATTLTLTTIYCQSAGPTWLAALTAGGTTCGCVNIKVREFSSPSRTSTAVNPGCSRVYTQTTKLAYPCAGGAAAACVKTGSESSTSVSLCTTCSGYVSLFLLLFDSYFIIDTKMQTN